MRALVNNELVTMMPYSTRCSTRICTLLWLAFVFSIAWCISGDDVLLYVPFDGDANAVVAHGGWIGSANAVVKFVDGIRGMAVRIGGGNTNKGGIAFPTDGNFEPTQGAISLWVMPFDWRVGDGRNHHFVVIAGQPHAYWFYVYYPGNTWFLLLRPHGNNRAIGGWKPRWKPNEWHHIVATWRIGEMCVYVDGKRTGRETEYVPVMKRAGKWILIGRDEATATAFDEFAIFRRALTPTEVQALYRRVVAKWLPPRITIPACTIAPNVDGVIGEDEWRDAVQVIGFIDEVIGVVSDEMVRAFAKFDDERIYIAIEVPLGDGRNPMANVNSRDGNVMRDDHIEIAISPHAPNERNGFKPKTPVHKLLVNAIGALRDERDGDAKWNSDAVVKSQVTGRVWAVEISAPLRNFGIALARGNATFGLNIAVRWSSSHKPHLTWAFVGKVADALGIVHLSRSAPAIKLLSLGEPNRGRIAIRIGARNMTPKSATLHATLHLRERKWADAITNVTAGGAGHMNLSATVNEPLADCAMLTIHAGNKMLWKIPIPFCRARALNVEAHHFPTKGKLQVALNATGAGVSPDERLSVMLALMREGDVLNERNVEGVTTATQLVSMDVRRLPAGKYRLRVTLCANGRTVDEISLPFEKRPLPKWWGNKLGITDKVPPPWTPLRIVNVRQDGQDAGRKSAFAVKCWGRVYTFAKSLFPAQIVTQGRELLAEPMRLRIKLKGGNEQIVQSGLVRIVEAKDYRVRLTARSEVDRITLTVRTLMEYDGFTWFDMSIEPRKPITIERLAFEIPYRATTATLFYSGSYTGKDTGAIKSEGYRGAFRNFFWVGCEDGGIEWFCEARAGWHITKRDRVLEIITPQLAKQEGLHLNHLTLVRLNIIDAPKWLNGVLKLSFGIQATPVRPKPKGWRKWRFGDDHTGHPFVSLWHTGWSVHLNYPVAKPHVRKWLREQYAKGILPCLYVQITKTSPRTDEYRYFYEEWRPIPSQRVDWEKVASSEYWVEAPVCVNSSFADFFIWHLARSIRRCDIRGLYFDCTGPILCANTSHGCGWIKENGYVHRTMAIRATRRFMQRIYVLMKEHNPNSVIAIHMSGTVLMPRDAFCDVMIDGEQFASQLQLRRARGDGENYYRLITLDKMRAQFMSHIWGPLTAFLPEFARALGDRFWSDEPDVLTAIEHLVGLFVLHDSQMWVAWSNPMPHWQVWRAQMRFGWDDEVEWIPYWRAQGLVDLETGGVEPVVCSIFKRRDRVMFVVFNNSDRDCKLTIRWNAKALGLANKRFVRIEDFYRASWWRMKPRTHEATIPMPKRNFRMLVPCER
ncbi:MAG TPA: hypothetical protein EYP10_14740 [Armatimonadetes bacterium]|nr:hypothetical protein [Armatimonadota bacterium]